MINVKELLEQKMKKVSSLDDKHKMEVIEKIIQEDDWEYKIGIQTVSGILRFLEVPEKEIKRYHLDLLSKKRFKAKVYTLIDSNEEMQITK